MPERSNGTVSKTVVLVTVPRVRIPLSPQNTDLKTDTFIVSVFFFANIQSAILKGQFSGLFLSLAIGNYLAILQKTTF